MKSDISGFPEFMPNEQIAFNKAVDSIKKHFELYGFVPMDTHSVERISTLIAKGNDAEIYGLFRLSNESKKDLGLRFDLTVPLARYVSSYSGELIFPYKRYQIAPVWRGERPQYGRYRQFYQCDIDVIGNESLSVEYDAEIVFLITEILQFLNIPAFHTEINNRKILSGFMKTIVAENKVAETLKLIDKIEKITSAEFDEEAIKLGIPQENLKKLKNFIDARKRRGNVEILMWLNSLDINEEYKEGVTELNNVFQALKKLGFEDSLIRVSPKLCRGLNYYTGTIFETVFNDINDVGSIAGGGRYDNLVEMLSDKKFPGVGATIGISRIVPKLIEKGILKADLFTSATVLVTTQNRDFIVSYMRIANKLRGMGIKTETYLQDKSLGVQLSYASRKRFKFVIIANEMELLEGTAIIKNLVTKEQKTIRTEYIANDVAEWISHDSSQYNR